MLKNNSNTFASALTLNGGSGLAERRVYLLGQRTPKSKPGIFSRIRLANELKTLGLGENTIYKNNLIIFH